MFAVVILRMVLCTGKKGFLICICFFLTIHSAYFSVFIFLWMKVARGSHWWQMTSPQCRNPTKGRNRRTAFPSTGPRLSKNYRYNLQPSILISLITGPFNLLCVVLDNWHLFFCSSSFIQCLILCMLWVFCLLCTFHLLSIIPFHSLCTLEQCAWCDVFVMSLRFFYCNLCMMLRPDRNSLLYFPFSILLYCNIHLISHLILYICLIRNQFYSLPTSKQRKNFHCGSIRHRSLSIY